MFEFHAFFLIFQTFCNSEYVPPAQTHLSIPFPSAFVKHCLLDTTEYETLKNPGICSSEAGI